MFGVVFVIRATQIVIGVGVIICSADSGISCCLTLIILLIEIISDNIAFVLATGCTVDHGQVQGSEEMFLILGEDLAVGVGGIAVAVEGGHVGNWVDVGEM